MYKEITRLKEIEFIDTSKRTRNKQAENRNAVEKLKATKGVDHSNRYRPLDAGKVTLAKDEHSRKL